MGYLKFDVKGTKQFVSDNELEEMQPTISMADLELRKHTGAGSDFTDWLDLPKNYDRSEFNRIKKAAEKIKSDSDVLITIGIGGSYLGARAVIESLQDSFIQLKDKQEFPLVLFAGNSLSGQYLHELLQILDNKDFSINVISKSGTTTEPAIAFRIFKNLLETRYGKEEARKRIYVTTDSSRGALKQVADSEGYEEFVVPDGVGGRFSVLTAVGLLPIATAGIDIDALMEGAFNAYKDYQDSNIENNDAYLYAALRNILYRKGKNIELLENYEPNLMYFAEWWKQLMGESEGKNQKGIYPSSANLSTDLHSLGQYIQEGRRNLMETVIRIVNPKYDVDIPKAGNDLDQLGYLEGRSLNYVNQKASEAVRLAHNDGNVPVMMIDLPKEDAYSMGYLIYFFELAVAISGYVNGVNPFNQPGVEDYKVNMFKLLGKPGY